MLRNRAANSRNSDTLSQSLLATTLQTEHALLQLATPPGSSDPLLPRALHEVSQCQHVRQRRWTLDLQVVLQLRPLRSELRSARGRGSWQSPVLGRAASSSSSSLSLSLS